VIITTLTRVVRTLNASVNDLIEDALEANRRIPPT
jgi:hypothetical protein